MPDTNPTIPRRTRHHPALPEQTPIDPRHKFRVPAHHTHFRHIPTGIAQLVIPPHSYTHVISATCENILEVSGPGNFAHGISVAMEDGHGSCGGVVGGDHARVEDAHFAVDGADGEGVGVVFIPVVG